jgi:hypothetical protein
MMTTEEIAGLAEIRRKRGWIWFWVLSYVPAVWSVRHTIHSNTTDIAVILIWAVGFIRSIARGMFCRCPRCGGLFFSTHGSPTMWNLLARKCMQCGLPLKAERIIYPSLE